MLVAKKEGLAKGYKKINLYFQDESRYGLKTPVGSLITAKGVAPKVKYQHKFEYT